MEDNGHPDQSIWENRVSTKPGVLQCALDPDPPPLAPAGSAAADAVAAVAAAAAAAGRRWAGRLVSLSPGELASSVSGGQLLSPSWAPELINTSPG